MSLFKQRLKKFSEKGDLKELDAYYLNRQQRAFRDLPSPANKRDELDNSEFKKL